MAVYRRTRRWVGLSLLLSLAVAVAGGCATPPDDPEERADFEAANDPLEPTNRAIFAVNRALDSVVIKPLSLAYRDALPESVRQSVHAFLLNASSPSIFVNDLLQGEGGRAATTAGRFLLNTGLGFFGMFDVAGESGMPFHEKDLGQTFALWGLPEGPYLMLPLFGPSSPRDTVGLGLELFLDPVGRVLVATDHTAWSRGRLGVSIVDQRAMLLDESDKIEHSSLDLYATLRTIYRQSRARAIRNAK
ncbi:MAG: VacJ family lipoprotein [Alphaproteobacteria bacterium]